MFPQQLTSKPIRLIASVGKMLIRCGSGGIPWDSVVTAVITIGDHPLIKLERLACPERI